MYLEGFETELESGFYNISVYEIYNPSVSGNPGDITLELLRDNTYTVLARNSGIESPDIEPGTISKVSISATPLMQNTPANYTFTFLPFNRIPEGGSIKIEFPATYNGLIAKSCYSISGLKPKISNSIVACTSTVTTVIFSSFKEVSSQFLKLFVSANNPSSSGNTPHFKIFTYDANSELIDQNSKAGYVTISTVQYPEGFAIDMFYAKVDNPIGSYGPIDVFIHPRFYVQCTVPPSTYIDIVLELPPALVIASGQLYCTFGSEQVPASNCVFTSGPPDKISIRTPVTTAIDCCPLSIKLTTVGTVPCGFTIPTTAFGKHIFLIKLYDSSGTQLEEAQFIYKSTPAPFAAFNLDYLHHTRDA